MRRIAVRPLAVLAGVLALYLAAPFAAGLAEIGAADWRGADLAGLGHASGISLAAASLATLLVALGGVPLGYVLARGRGTGWTGGALAALGFVAQLPLALPPLSAGVLLLFLFGYSGPLGGLGLTDCFPGIVAAEAFVAAPFLVIAARSAFAAADPTLEDVAASLGHGKGAVFRRVSLPLAWRPILAGLLMAWLRAFGEFGATVMMAYHPFSLPVYTYIAFGSEGLPAMLPVLLPTLVAAIGVMVASLALLRPPRQRIAPPAPLAPIVSEPVAAVPAAPRAVPAPLPFAVHARRHLEGFSLDVAWRSPARRLGILGASGSGKSLTLREIAGFGTRGDSSVRLGGRDLGALPPQARGIAYVPQNYGLFPHLRLAEQVRFGATSDPALAAAWTARLGLAGLEARHPAELSLGQQQRVALARALALRGAGLILLDEPFSALDTPLRLRLRRELGALQRDLAPTTILVTHDPAEAMQLADELLLMQDGRALQSGPVASVFSRPASEAAARLLGAEAIGAGRAVSAEAIDIGAGVVLRVAGAPLATGSALGWAAHPHQIRPGRAGTYPAEILARGPVTDGQRRVRLRLGAGVLESLADPSCPPEGECRVEIDPEAIQVWPASTCSGPTDG